MDVKVKTKIFPHTKNLVDPKTRRTNSRSRRRKGSGQLAKRRERLSTAKKDEEKEEEEVTRGWVHILCAESGTCLN